MVEQLKAPSFRAARSTCPPRLVVWLVDLAGFAIKASVAMGVLGLLFPGLSMFDAALFGLAATVLLLVVVGVVGAVSARFGWGWWR